MLARLLTTLVAALLLAAPAAAAAGALPFDRGRHEIHRRVRQDFGAASHARLRDCFAPGPGLVQCRGTARVRVPGGADYRCRKYYRAQSTPRGVLVTESRAGRRFRTFAPALCRPV